MPVDAQSLLPPLNPAGLPAPVWFLQFFKLVGFILHLWPMHLFFAGSMLAAAAMFQGGPTSRTAAARLGRVLPFAVAIGVNFGIVPLLFVQVTHYRLFYPATILMAWPWFSVVPILVVAYYGIYLFSWQQREPKLRPWAGPAILIGAVGFVLISFLFVNTMTLMVEPDRWVKIWQDTDTSGAVTGLGLNWTEGSLLPRWLMMFGLALGSVGAWLAIDTAFFAKDESETYRTEANTLAVRIYGAGTALAMVMGAIYIFGTLPDEVRGWLLSGWRLPLFGLTSLAPLLGFAALVWQSRQATAKSAWLVLAAHFGVLVVNAVSRQLVQTASIRPLNVLGAEPVNTQWTSLPLFLLCFVFALACVGWMLRRFWVEAVAGGPGRADSGEDG